jgi:hypothetical protein
MSSSSSLAAVLDNHSKGQRARATGAVDPPNNKSGRYRHDASDNTPYALAYNKFMLYEMKNRFYIIASNSLETRHRITRIDRTSQDELTIVEDETLYSGKRMGELLRTLDDGNRAQGGLGKPRCFHGVAGERFVYLYW